jgi:hypothetical protein
MKAQTKKHQVKQEGRPRCPKHGTLLNIHTGKCVLYNHFPRNAKAKVEAYLRGLQGEHNA